MTAFEVPRCLAVFTLLLLVLPLLPLPATAAVDEGLHYEFHFESPSVSTITKERTFSVRGLESDAAPGSPVLPIKTVMLALPVGQALKEVQIAASEPRELEKMERYPLNPNEITVGDLAAPIDPLPEGHWELVGTYVLEGVSIVCLNLRPVSWDAAGGRITFVQEIGVTLKTEKAPLAWLGDLERVRDAVDNPEVLPDVQVIYGTDLLPDGQYSHLIITSFEMAEAFQALSDWKGERSILGSKCDDIRSVTVTLDQVRSMSFVWGNPASHGGKGNDTQTQVRNFIAAAHREWGVEYVLLGGDEEVLPSRKLWVSKVNSVEWVPGDVYYTGLDGDWDADGDGIYGEPVTLTSPVDEADPLAEVFVGRAPVSSAREAWNFVNKTIDYERGYLGQYPVDLLLVGQMLNDDPLTWGGDYTDEVYREVLEDEGLSPTTLYERDRTFSAEAFLDRLEMGTHLVNHMGHGNYGSFADLTIYDARDVGNQDPFVLYTQACMVAGFDQGPEMPNDCIAEEFLKGENGAVAFIGNSRYGWYAPGSTDGSSQRYALSFFSQVYQEDVAQLGRALSLSKEERIGMLGTNTMRWVFMELNLLGDPETQLLRKADTEHDLALVDLDAGEPVMGRTGTVGVRVQNLGDVIENGTVRLFIDGEEVGARQFELVPGSSDLASFEWTPSESKPYTLRAEVRALADGAPENDVLERKVIVARCIEGSEIWEDRHVELSGGLVIGEGGSLVVRNCSVEFLPSDVDYRISVHGSLVVHSSSVFGSAYGIEGGGGAIGLNDSSLSGASPAMAGAVAGGAISMLDSTFEGGSGWSFEGAGVTIEGCEFLDQTSGWVFDGCSMNVSDLTGTGGGGMLVQGSNGSLRSLTWTGGGKGLVLENCGGMELYDLTLVGNGADITLRGASAEDMQLSVSNVMLGAGPLVLLRGADNMTFDGTAGSLVLVECDDLVVRGQHLWGNGQGILMYGCRGIEVMGNAIENCSVGILSIQSSALVWCNDLIGNEVQAARLGGEVLFDNGYPRGGNHWSDQQGEDVFSGQGQNETGEDGTFDDPYRLEEDMDRYPKVNRCSFEYDVLQAGIAMPGGDFDVLTPVSFQDASASGCGIANWTWDFGDGVMSYGKSVQHLYQEKGEFVVRLTVTDHRGEVDSASRDLLVVNHLPVCDFGYSPSQPGVMAEVSFQDLSEDQDGTLVSWHWDFGDGGSSNDRSPDHVFAAEGDYLVVLTVVDQDGGGSTCTKKVPVGNMAPTAGMSWSPANVTSLSAVTFTANASDVDGSIVEYRWAFGDGSSAWGQTVQHRYSRPSTYTVTLTVVDDDGASSMVTGRITVQNAIPVAIFNVQGEMVRFADVSFVDSSFDPDGKVVSWSWDLGDGNVSSDRSPVHAYTRLGDFTVTLTVKDDRGGSGVCVKSLSILNLPPTVTVEQLQGDHFSLQSIPFTGNATDLDGEVVSYRWDMGDGSVLEGMTVSHAYSAPGDYLVRLTCLDDAGGEGEALLEVSIRNLAPSASLVVEQGEGHPLEMLFSSTSHDLDGSLVGFNWSFGDGSFGEGEEARHRYAASGDYLVVLNVTDDRGGWSASSMTLEVRAGGVTVDTVDWTWDGGACTLSAVLINRGALPIEARLFVEAGGETMESVHAMGAGESIAVNVTLEGFEGGDVTVRLNVGEDWDDDLTDNLWTGVIERPAEVPWVWIIALGSLATIGAAFIVLRRR